MIHDQARRQNGETNGDRKEGRKNHNSVSMINFAACPDRGLILALNGVGVLVGEMKLVYRIFNMPKLEVYTSLAHSHTRDLAQSHCLVCLQAWRYRESQSYTR